MKILLDANISWRLASKLQIYFEVCLHVDYVGLTIPATDIKIWNFAFENQMVIVTNDEDFIHLSQVKGFPPKVILLRTGNQSSKYILELLIKLTDTIEDFSKSDENGILEIY